MNPAAPPDTRRLVAQARQQALAARREFDRAGATDAAEQAAQWLSDVRRVAAKDAEKARAMLKR
jgi:hypothetical protein